MRPPATLLLHDLHVSHGRVPALTGVSLEVAAGEFMVLLGPSGSGKSTLLAAVAGLLDVDRGRVVLGGSDITRFDPGERDIAIVFQSYALYPTMTVAENLTFGMRMRGVGRADIAVKLAETAEMLGLGPLLKRRPSQLSGGEPQRVALGRAMVREPLLFMLDEPLSNLDARLRAEMRSEIALLHRRLGTTTLFVTHDPAEAMSMATRIGIMREGRIVQTGSPLSVYDRPSSLFVAGLLGAPGMGLIAGRIMRTESGFIVAAGGISLPACRYEWREPPLEGRPVLLGLRPEDVGVVAADTLTVRATPTLVQPTGADLLVQFEVAGSRIHGRLRRDDRSVLGQPMPIGLRLARASIFCATSGVRL